MTIQPSSAVKPTCSACGLPIEGMSYIGWNGHNYHNHHVPSREPPPAWMPIETAPRDGTSILLYEGFEPIICQGYCGPESGEWMHGRGLFWREPTHWMPLPAPPRS